jgi:hypothetical protein
MLWQSGTTTTTTAATAATNTSVNDFLSKKEVFNSNT